MLSTLKIINTQITFIKISNLKYIIKSISLNYLPIISCWSTWKLKYYIHEQGTKVLTKFATQMKFKIIVNAKNKWKSEI